MRIVGIHEDEFEPPGVQFDVVEGCSREQFGAGGGHDDVDSVPVDLDVFRLPFVEI